MYQGFKVLRRNPISYNPRGLGLLFLGYFGFCIYKQISLNYISGIRNYGEPHSQDYNEELRQYNAAKLTEFNNWVRNERQLLLQQQLDEAKDIGYKTE